MLVYQLVGYIMLNLESIPQNEQKNVISVYWQMLKSLEMTADDTLSKHDVEAYYRLWNRMTGDNKSPNWIK